MSNNTPKATNNRPKRTPLYQRGRLAVTASPGYTQRWVNDEPGRIEAFLEAGYRLVPKAKDDSVRYAEDGSNIGSFTSKVVNKDQRANSKVAYLMEIPDEIYKEDQAAKQRDVDRSEERMNPKLAGADYGEMKKSYK